MKSLTTLLLLAGLTTACAGKQDGTTALPQACTEEAKVCDDGSTVARSGPACEFQACPGESETLPPAGYPCEDGEDCPGTDCVGEDCPSL